MQTKMGKWDAEDYARSSSAQEVWADELISKLSLKGDENLLDIGSGDGRVTHKLATIIQAGSVVGIDQSESMVKLANDKFSEENLSFIQMDATQIDFETKFDVAFSNATLHWIGDHQAVLKCLRNNLENNGRILFQMGGFGNAEELLEVVAQVIGSKVWKRYFQYFIFPYTFRDAADYEIWLPSHGYKPARIELIPKDMVHDNPNGLKGWFRTTWFPFTDRLPVCDRENFLNALVAEYISQYPVDTEGRTHVKMVRLEVEANACA
jgi:trans-aconitate 2-methyltransferase